MDMKPREWGTVTVIAFGFGTLFGAALFGAPQLLCSLNWTALAAVGTVAAFFGVLYVHWSSGERQRRRDRQLAAPKATMIYRELRDAAKRLQGVEARAIFQAESRNIDADSRARFVDFLSESYVPRSLEKFVGDIGTIDAKASSELAHVLADSYRLDEVGSWAKIFYSVERVDGLGLGEKKYLVMLREALATLQGSISRALPLLRPYTSLAPQIAFLSDTVKASDSFESN